MELQGKEVGLEKTFKKSLFPRFFLNILFGQLVLFLKALKKVLKQYGKDLWVKISTFSQLGQSNCKLWKVDQYGVIKFLHTIESFLNLKNLFGPFKFKWIKYWRKDQ